MKNLLIPIIFAVTIFFICHRISAQKLEQEPKRLIDYVNPFVGSGAYGHTFPGACLPFGMVQLSPDNGAVGRKNYYYQNDTIFGFSHTHLSGTGLGASTKYANISFMPAVSSFENNSGFLKINYGTTFSHENEEAHPGYYKVVLDDGVQVELTTTERVGIHRYQFPKTNIGNVIIDITKLPNGGGAQGKSIIKVIGNNRLAGYTTVVDKESKENFTTYFYSEFNVPFKTFDTFNSFKFSSKKRSATGTVGVGAKLVFDVSKNREVIVKTGISFSSIGGAKKNLFEETQNKDFYEIKNNAEDVWERKLGKIMVSGGTLFNKMKFYTSLYHSLLFPRTFSDVDGSYFSHFKNKIMSSDNRYYVDFSLWDTYRAVHPLFNILEPERQMEMINTLLTMYDQGGRIPLRTSYRNFYSNEMIGDHGSTIILDSYMKGLRDFDIEKAYAGMLKNAFEIGPMLESREGLESYENLGYVAADQERESVSLTLEHSFVDWGLAQVAKSLMKMEDYKLLMTRSENYKNLYDSSVGFFRPKLSNRKWLPSCEKGEEPEILTNGNHTYYGCFDKWWIGVSPNRHYTESNAYQYFYVPHDTQGLIDLMGGNKKFVNRLDDLFTESSSNSGPWYQGVTGAIGQYIHGNEPSHHVAYLFNYAGTPWKTQERVREIMESKYGVDSRGLPGNDDMGQISAWFVFSAMGFYPVTPGNPTYQIGSPLFEKTVINLDSYYGKREFIITAVNASGDNKYIQSAKINGKILVRPWITHDEIVNGGILEFQMGPNPNFNWGTSADMKTLSIEH